MYNFGSFDAFIVKPTILPEICSTIIGGIVQVVCCSYITKFAFPGNMSH